MLVMQILTVLPFWEQNSPKVRQHMCLCYRYQQCSHFGRKIHQMWGITTLVIQMSVVLPFWEQNSPKVGEHIGSCYNRNYQVSAGRRPAEKKNMYRQSYKIQMQKRGKNCKSCQHYAAQNSKKLLHFTKVSNPTYKVLFFC